MDGEERVDGVTVVAKAEGMFVRRRGDAEKGAAFATPEVHFQPTSIPEGRLRRPEERRSRPDRSPLPLRISAPPREQVLSFFFGAETR